MMRKSSQNSTVLILVLGTTLFLVCVFLLLGGLPAIVSFLLSGGDPTYGTTAPTRVSVPTSAFTAPISIGVGKTFGKLTITVTRVTRPADKFVLNADKFAVPGDREEYLMVSLNAYCSSLVQPCPLNLIDFGVSGTSSLDYPSEAPGNYPALQGLLEGGGVAAERVASGSLIFIVRKDDSRLVMFYPRSAAARDRARFSLTN